MDNNLKNGSGIPNVSDIKFDDTPAESFENLYGGSSQNNNASVNSGVGMTSNPSVNSVQSNFGQVSQQPNLGGASVNQPINPVNVGPSVQPNPVTMENNIGMSVNPQMVPNMPQQPNIGVQPTASQSVQPAAPQSVQPNVGVNINQSVNTSNVQPQPAMVNPSAFSMNQEPVMTPNPINVTSNGDALSNINIDADRMQSIEEQLSKTSQYNPSDFQQEQIVIPNDNQSDKGKSSLTFIIVLFIILAVVIAFLPQITKMIK